MNRETLMHFYAISHDPNSIMPLSDYCKLHDDIVTMPDIAFALSFLRTPKAFADYVLIQRPAGKILFPSIPHGQEITDKKGQKYFVRNDVAYKTCAL